MSGQDDLSTRDLVVDEPDDGREQRPDDEPARLFQADDSESYLRRWESVQATFVDDPRAAVEHADGLVAEVIRQLAQTFSEERERLETQWGSGADVSTEDLRLALQRYRAFFNRLLEV